MKAVIEMIGEGFGIATAGAENDEEVKLDDSDP